MKRRNSKEVNRFLRDLEYMEKVGRELRWVRAFMLLQIAGIIIGFWMMFQGRYPLSLLAYTGSLVANLIARHSIKTARKMTKEAGWRND